LLQLFQTSLFAAPAKVFQRLQFNDVATDNVEP